MSTASVIARTRSAIVPGPDGFGVAVHDLGGTGPAILFVHATGMHGLIWASVAAQLDDQFHCWAVDLRGHGDSPVSPQDDLNWTGFGRDVLTAVEAIGERPVIGIGHSLGAVALVRVAATAPAAIDQLVLYEPAMRGDAGPAVLHQLAVLREAMVNGTRSRRSSFLSHADALLNYARRPPLAELEAATLLAYVEHGFGTRPDGTVALKCSPQVEAQIYAQTPNHDTPDLLKAVQCPTTIVKGSATAALQADSADWIATTLGASAVEIEDMDHFGPLAQPGRFATTIRSILHR